jgi:ion channel
MIVNVLAAAAGILLVLLTLRDVFQVVIVPRAVDRRLRVSAGLTFVLWSLWPRITNRFVRDADRREDILAMYAPFVMVLLLVTWVVLLITGYGLVLFALRGQLSPQPISLGAAFYFAGTSLLTIGFGDIAPTGWLARLVSLMAGASGLGVVAVVTTFLFSVFGSFQRRERFVVIVGARAGAPPSGIGLLAVASKAHVGLNETFREGQQWTAEVMESHRAYPILAFFRSSHDYESWVATLGALLDAATLLLAAVNDDEHGEARIMYVVGRHATHDLASYFGFGDGETTSPGIERHEFEAACRRMRAAGYRMRRGNCWPEFSRLRSGYAMEINHLARRFEVPPVAWVGDRSLITAPHARAQIS